MADISSITVPSGDVYNLKDEFSRERTVYYGTSNTAAGTQIKDATVNGVASLYDGLCVRILFATAQTYDGAPKLNINSLGAKNIQRVVSTNAGKYEWDAGECLDLVYNGSAFIIVDGGIATTSAAGLMSASDKTVIEAARAASGLLKCDGSGTISAAVAGTDYVAANQGSANANKFLAVNSSGYVTLVTITSAGGVEF